jgi:hypothetical protein
MTQTLLTDSNPSTKLNDLRLVQEICSATNALQAHRLFEKYASSLQDWQIIFAEASDAGSVKLLHKTLGSSGIATSIFRGKSLWVMDAKFVVQRKPSVFQGGSAMFVDSNAATCIRAIAYDDGLSEVNIKRANLINQISDRFQHLNPYLYLWESIRSWNEETIIGCTQSVAAMHALSKSGSKLTPEWGWKYRKTLRDEAENFASTLLLAFTRDLRAGTFTPLNDQLALVEIALLRTLIIDLSTKKSKEQKLAQLVTYMHEELATIALRELIVCGDILLRSARSRIAKKLNSIQNNSDPLSLVKNCSWDMYIPRVLDALTAISPDQTTKIDFCIAEILSFDGDVTDIINTTKLRAIAVHRPSKRNFPFFDSDVAEWLGNRIGSKRMATISDFFSSDAFFDRATRRQPDSIQVVLEANRKELMRLIREFNS